MDSLPHTPFVDTGWLAARLSDPAVQVIDGSWYLPTQNRNGAEEYRAGHIPGAIFLDIDAVADPSSGLPHMLLDEAAFARTAGALGISSDTILVVYDGAGLFSAPRVWWMLRLYGARDVRILAGGLPKWRSEERPLEAGPRTAPLALFHARRLPDAVVDLTDVRAALKSGSAQVVDARPAPRFRGEAPEPRPGVRSGHMPGSLNMPFADIVVEGQLKSPDELLQAFRQSGVDLEAPIITSCGSGVSAAILTLALETIGKRDVRLYDGSWAEYGSDRSSVVATGQ